MAIKIQNDTVIYDDKVFKVASGTTAQRPGTPAAGMMRVNTDDDSLELYSNSRWAFAGGVRYTRRTTAYTARAKEGIIGDTTSAAFTVTLPASPASGDYVVFVDGANNWGTNNLTVARNGQTIEGLAEDLVLDISGSKVTVVFDGTTWHVHAQIGALGGNAVTTTGTQTLTNKTYQNAIFDGAYTEDIFTITDGASVDLNPANGTIQLWTLGANRSPTANSFNSGQSMLLMIDDGTGFTITSWPSVNWLSGGGTQPALATSGYTGIVLWKVASTLYGARVGSQT